ncbi:hypothetical protein [Sandarakinorhabdus sp. DWP1-3-1]|uniref:hypothetical protein n=1 Tax=Sandarakinorhabdus sp. DWP1-3-1 TaxID=2804627 RepID=UPI003CEE9803
MFFVVFAVVAMLIFAVVMAAMLQLIGFAVLIAVLAVLFALMFGGSSSTFAIVAGLATLAWLMTRRRKRPLPPWQRRAEPAAAPAPRRRVAEAAPRTTDPALADAWNALAGHADWARSRVAVARASCDRFLQLADRAPLHSEAAELAILIRKRIPEHVDEALSKLDLATSAEARALLDDAVTTVEKVGARAERLRDTLMTAETAALGVQRTHLSRRSDNEPFTLN